MAARPYTTPDVYVEEISVFPPSVAEVATAIPVFIGYTERADNAGASLSLKPTKVKSLLQYQQYFGFGSKPTTLQVELAADNSVSGTTITPRFHLYDSLRLYFNNNGGECYIVSVGDYSAGPAKDKLIAGLDAASREDEPTIIVVPDAVLLNDNDCAEIQQKMLRQCEVLQDRVAVLDVKDASDPATGDAKVQAFRNGIGMNALKYGAAYYPYLRTNLAMTVRYADLTIKKGAATTGVLASVSADRKAVDSLDNSVADLKSLRAAAKTARDAALTAFNGVGATNNKAELTGYASAMKNLATAAIALGTGLTSSTMSKAIASATDGKSALADLVRELYGYDLGYDIVTPAPAALGVVAPANFAGYNLTPAAKDQSVYGGKNVEADAVAAGRPAFRSLFFQVVDAVSAIEGVAQAVVDSDESLVISTNPIYQRILDAVKNTALTLPPSGALAGVYCYVDATRGVWKAPANVSLSSVVAPAIAISSPDQGPLNVDSEAGKSINVIRTFAGRGVLVWGARTLAGNDNEWRYVSVRRFFNTAEESIKKSTYWAVFEPNDANLWIKVKAMIENYLTQKWRDGALAGAKPNDAFFVRVGLGVTMSPQDILEGRLNVEIGMAVVRPAEFIVLKFSHKMQTS